MAFTWKPAHSFFNKMQRWRKLGTKHADHGRVWICTCSFQKNLKDSKQKINSRHAVHKQSVIGVFHFQLKPG